MKRPASKKGGKVAIRSRFSSAQLLMFAVVFAAAGGLLIWKSFAAPPNKSGSGTPLALVSETSQWNPNITNHTCQTEDDYHNRNYSGSLNGSFSATEQLCNLSLDNLTSGGIGLRAYVSVVGTLSDLTITAPGGAVHHAVLMSSSTYKHVTTNNYAVCFVPLYFVSTDTGTNPLSEVYPGNPWTYTLSGNISKANLQVFSQMLDVNYQKSDCPVSEQNLQ